MIKKEVLALFCGPDFLSPLPGLKPTFEAFMCFALTMSLVSLAGVSLAFLVSASVSSFAMANILIALPFVFMMVRHQDTYLRFWVSQHQEPVHFVTISHS